MGLIMRNWLLFLLLLGPCDCVCMAQVQAVITGPTEARVGDLVVLSGRESGGDNFKWVEPQKIQTLLCGDGKDLAFATGTPGSYQFMLIAADKQADIHYTQHTVIVRGTLPPEPTPEPEPIPSPEPTPPPANMQELVKISRDAAAKLNDAPTARAIATAIQQAATDIESGCKSGMCPGIDLAKSKMVKAIELALLARTGNSRNVDWMNGWRVPINAAVVRLGLNDVPSYVTAMRAIAVGLN